VAHQAAAVEAVPGDQPDGVAARAGKGGEQRGVADAVGAPPRGDPRSIGVGAGGQVVGQQARAPR